MHAISKGDPCSVGWHMASRFFSLTSGMLTKQQGSVKEGKILDVLLITPCCRSPRAESYCFMQICAQHFHQFTSSMRKAARSLWCLYTHPRAQRLALQVHCCLKMVVFS